jgi:hypothetical protein
VREPRSNEPVLAKEIAAMNQAETRADPDSPVPSLVARLFAESPLGIRRKLVACLAGVAGPLALAALAEGRFARFLLRSPSEALGVSLEEARRLTEGQVLALARYAWEASPQVFVRLAEMLHAEDPMLLRTLTGALFLLAMGMRSRGSGRDRGG